MSETITLEVPIAGMDCAECTEHVRHAIAGLPGVVYVDVFLASEKATVRLDPSQVEPGRDPGRRSKAPATASLNRTRRRPGGRLAEQRLLRRGIGLLLAALSRSCCSSWSVGEWLGVFERLDGAPCPCRSARAGADRRLPRLPQRDPRHAAPPDHLAHLMTLGVLAALAVGQWVTALVVVFFMRVGDAVERFTTERARRASRT